MLRNFVIPPHSLKGIKAIDLLIRARKDTPVPQKSQSLPKNASSRTCTEPSFTKNLLQPELHIKTSRWTTGSNCIGPGALALPLKGSKILWHQESIHQTISILV